MILNEMLSKGMIAKNEKNGLVDPTSVLKLLNSEEHSEVVDALLNNPATSEATAKLFIGAAKTLHNQTGVDFGIDYNKADKQNIANIRHKLDNKIEQATQINDTTDKAAQFFNLISDPSVKPQSQNTVSEEEYRTMEFPGKIVADIRKMSSQQIDALMSKIGDQVVSNNQSQSYQSIYQDNVQQEKKGLSPSDATAHDADIKRKVARDTIHKLMYDKYFSVGDKQSGGNTGSNNYHQNVFLRAAGVITHQKLTEFKDYKTALNNVVESEKKLAGKPKLLDIANNIPEDINVNLGGSEQVSLREMFKAYPGAVLSVIAESMGGKKVIFSKVEELERKFPEDKNPYTASPLHSSIYDTIAKAVKQSEKQDGMLKFVKNSMNYTSSSEYVDYKNSVKDSKDKLSEVHETLHDTYGLDPDATNQFMGKYYQNTQGAEVVDPGKGVKANEVNSKAQSVDPSQNRGINLKKNNTPTPSTEADHAIAEFLNNFSNHGSAAMC
jgi:hypothetical protein